MYRILIWGTGVYYNKHINLIKFEELKGSINVVGITSNSYCYSNIDGYKFIEKDKISQIEFDYIVVAANDKTYIEICNEVIQMGIDADKILKISIFKIPNFEMSDYLKIYESKLSIVAPNCWGGITYNQLGMKFYSPFINMFESEDDYLKLLLNLEHYLGQEVEFYDWGYNDQLKMNYPIGKIKDVKLQFNHYSTFEEAKKCWDKRLKRFNFNNMFIMMFTDKLYIAEQFDKLPYKNKVVFTTFPSTLSSAMEIKIYNEYMQNALNNEFYRMINGLAGGGYIYYDVLKLLNNTYESKRIETKKDKN